MKNSYAIALVVGAVVVTAAKSESRAPTTIEGFLYENSTASTNPCGIYKGRALDDHVITVHGMWPNFDYCVKLKHAMNAIHQEMGGHGKPFVQVSFPTKFLTK